MVQSGERFVRVSRRASWRSLPPRPEAQAALSCCSSEDGGSGLVPTQLGDVEQDLAVPGTEIDMSVDSLPGVSVALEHDLCGHHCGSHSPLVTVTPADPNVRARVMGVVEVDNSSDSATVPTSSGAVRRHRDPGVWYWCQVRGLMQFPQIFEMQIDLERWQTVRHPRVARTACRVGATGQDGTPQSIQDERTEDDASSVGRPEEFNLGRQTRKVCQVMGHQQ